MLIPYFQKMPEIQGQVFLEDSARIIGDVRIGHQSSIWFNVVVRGDVNYIRIGERTNIQDGSVVHVTHDTHPTIVGDEVTIGHNVTLHGCTIGNRCLIGMGSVILDGVIVGNDCLIAAGSLVPPGMRIPDGHLAIGNPARVKRALTGEEIENLQSSAANYVEYMETYLSLHEEKGKIG